MHRQDVTEARRVRGAGDVDKPVAHLGAAGGIRDSGRRNDARRETRGPGWRR
jgi:hypothetical protein